MSTPKNNASDSSSDTIELYKKREKIYPREVKGRFANMRNAAVIALLGLYYILPWISWNGRQAVLLDLPARQFHYFGITFWPQDFFYLTVLLIIAALSLFFFTTLAGRLWCGYACPQTVWTEVFIWMERWIEGSRSKQMRLDKEEMGGHKFAVKATKHTVWILFSLWTGFTFVGFFTPIKELGVNLMAGNLGPWEWFWVFFYGFATYGNAGWMREQVCKYMCPYARFQSAMFDKDTLIISYDADRGEPRGARKRNVDPKTVNKGDCVDCTMCVQVCPTGIDIRDGLQYECIGCAACIDVCDDVMARMGYEKGLVRYTTEHEMAGGKTHIFRPRILVYGAILSGLFIALIVAVSLRNPLEIDIIRDRNALYRETPQDEIENVYTLKIINKSQQAYTYNVNVSGLEGIKLAKEAVVTAKPGEVKEMIVTAQVPTGNIKSASQTIYFIAEAQEDPNVSVSEGARFLGPMKR